MIFKQKILSGRYLHLTEWFQREFYDTPRSLGTSKFGHFWPKTLDLPIGHDCHARIGLLSHSRRCSQHHWGQVKALTIVSRDRRLPTTPWKKVDFWTKYKYSFKSLQSNKCVWKRLLRHLFRFQRAFYDSPGSLGSWKNEKCRLKNLTKSRELTPWKKVVFCTKYKFSFKSFQSNSVCPKTSPEILCRPPKGPGTKKYPTKDEVRVRVKQKILC